jgi:ribosome maturation factor RimP
MSKASLILTDELIDAATTDGSLPPQPGDEAFEGFETDDAETETLEDSEESGV